MQENVAVEVYPMIIGDQAVTGSSGQVFNVINPSTEEIIAAAPVASPAEIDLAVQTANTAFKKWRQTPAAERAAAMLKLVQAVRDNAEDLARTITMEQGKPLWQSRGEIGGFCAVIEFYAQEARRIQGLVLQSDNRDRFVYVLRHPMGVVAAIPPWNDPLHLLSRMIGPAFAAGCTVVAKPSSDTPLATIKVARAALAAGFPPGVFNVITGPGALTGEALVRHPLVRKVSLTGSIQSGRQVMRIAADDIKRLTLELGGQCPCIVWNDADLLKASEALTFQAFRGAGQVCNRVNRVYVHQDCYDDLVERVTRLAARVVVGDGFKEGVDIGPLVNARQLKWVDSQVQDADSRGARLLCGGQQVGDVGFFYAPTVLADCDPSMQVLHEETFGPVLAFMKIGGDLEQAFDLANDTPYGLSSYFFSRDARNCYLAAERLEAGSIWINDIHGSFIQAPYGGMKASGIGREQGSIAVDDYLEWKTVYQEMSNEPRGARACVHPNE